MASISQNPATFNPRHRADRTAVLACVIVIWLVIVTGFSVDMVKKAAAHKLDYPWIVHAHALAYGGWLLLLAAQIWLVRTHNVALHRRLGMAVLAFLPLMLILGPAVALAINTAKPHISDWWLSFMSTQFTNVLGSTTLILAGFLARRDAASHKRLMLMGTIAITEPGFSRVIAGPLTELFGNGFWPYIAEIYPGTILLMLSVGGYDLVTRKRLHPAWIAALAWVLANELLASWLAHEPFWLGWMKQLTGH